MGYQNNHDDVNLDASYDFSSDIDMCFTSYTDVVSYLTVDQDINVCVDIDGNAATFQIDLQAFGHDTSTDLNLVVVVEQGEWSSITASGYAAAN